MSSKLLQGFRLGPWNVEPLRGVVSGPNGESHHLEPKVMDVFVCLAERANELVTRNQLLDVAWTGNTAFDEQLTRAIGELRRALHDNPSDPKYIETVPKRGYRLIGQVRLAENIKPEKHLTPGSAGAVLLVRHRMLWAVGVASVAVLAVMVGLNAGGLRERLQGAATPGPITSIAVLPLDNLSGDPEQEYFADGMTEALIAELGGIKQLRVISRTSAMHYKTTDKLLPEIARELGVDALLEGSVLRAGDEVRITLQLVHGSTDRHLWSKNFQRDLRDVLPLQREVARSIAEEIQITMTPSLNVKLQPPAGSEQAREPDPVAYEAYLKGRFYFNRAGNEGYRTALRSYEEAVALDPTFALAYAALAEVCLMPPIRNSEIRSMQDCERAALEAVRLDEQLAEAHAALGATRAMQWDWAGSESEFKRALELNPNSVMAHQRYALMLRATMRHDEAVREIRRAAELDPLNLLIKTMVGWPLLDLHRYDEALAQWNQVLEMEPEYGLAHYNKGLVYIEMGMSEHVLESARRAAKWMGEDHPARLMLIASGHAIGGDEDIALGILAEVERDYSKVMSVWIANVHLRLGNEEAALARLEKAYEDRLPRLAGATSEPSFDILRNHPRFQALRRNMGLP